MNYNDRLAANNRLVEHYLNHPDEFKRFVAALLCGDVVAIEDRPLTDWDTSYIYQSVRQVWKGRNYDGSCT